MSILEVNDLSVKFRVRDGEVAAVNKVSFALEKGEILGVVGESGSGKSQLVLSMLGLLASNGEASGSVKFDGQELIGMKPAALNEIRGDRVSMIFQDPMTCLNGYLTIAKQMTEVLMLHKGMDYQTALARSTEMLDAVKIPDAKNRVKRYPHEFSGGMRQRVMIAMSLLCKPDLLIADEPTTALDVTVQAQIIELLNDLKEDLGMSIIMITHDLGVIAGISDNVLVMYASRAVEYAPVHGLFESPNHPYTKALLRSIPRLDKAGQEDLYAIPGNPPNLLHLPQGCAFAERCDHQKEKCLEDRPLLRSVSDGRQKACHLDVLP